MQDERMDEFTGLLILRHGFKPTKFAYQTVLERAAHGSEPQVTVVVDHHGRGQYLVRVRATSLDVEAYGTALRCLSRLANRLERRAAQLLQPGPLCRPHVANSAHVIAALAAEACGGQLVAEGGAPCAH